MPFRAPSRRAVTPGGRGRFPGFDVLGEVERWDDVTAGIVLSRLDPPADFSFFTPAEQATAGALFDMLLAQHEDPKVPVLRLVDERLALDETDGWFYEDMPEDQEAWRRSLAALDAEASERFGALFAQISLARRCALVQAVQDGSITEAPGGGSGEEGDGSDGDGSGEEGGGDGTWRGLNPGHVWSLWTRYACAAFYSHPWAWNEIGFGGPAYPRGYVNLGVGKLEHWEVPDNDRADPVPWAERVEAARKAHAELTGFPHAHAGQPGT